MRSLPRAVRVTAVALCLASAAGTVGRASRSETPASPLLRGVETFESQGAPIGSVGGKAGAGGVSAADDWLG